MSNSARSRLQAVLGHTSRNASQKPPSARQTPEELLAVLPGGGKITIIPAAAPEGVNTLIFDGEYISLFSVSESTRLAFAVTSINTPFEDAPTSHLPTYPLVTLGTPPGKTEISLEGLWTTIYALFTIQHENENIPMVFDRVANMPALMTYLITSGLAQKRKSVSAVFLSRSTFWQGAGTTGYHTQPNWHLAPPPSPFPSVATFTRTDKVIASHPLRPTKPAAGTMLYRRWCSAVKQNIDFTFFDIDGVADGSGGPGRISRHMAAFDKWHNDERVNNAWGERGSLAEHRAYVERVLADPHVWPLMMSWDGELMGYVEIIYTKEDHVAAHFPTGVVPGDWERGVHVLVGEQKFLGNGRAEIWFRSLIHYCFLADPRTERVMGEPSQANIAIQRTCMKAGFHVETVFDFPYKRSALILNPRERFFRLCNLW